MIKGAWKQCYVFLPERSWGDTHTQLLLYFLKREWGVMIAEAWPTSWTIVWKKSEHPIHWWKGLPAGTLLSCIWSLCLFSRIWTEKSPPEGLLCNVLSALGDCHEVAAWGALSLTWQAKLPRGCCALWAVTYHAISTQRANWDVTPFTGHNYIGWLRDRVTNWSGERCPVPLKEF